MGSRAKHDPAGVPAIVRDLVSQFDQPLDLLRELMQNSIDAGANRVDVSLRYDGGRAFVSVEDDGEGMDEAAIEGSLLSLFRSAKEGDFTKIGRFGVGFVSVFAMEPDRVRLHTGKDGRSWSVDFEDLGRCSVSESEEVREGTRVELEKRMERVAFDSLASQARSRVRRWAGHSEARVFFSVEAPGVEPASEQVSAPFSLEGASFEHREEGTEILMGFSDEESPPYAFYNRGLLLKEGRKTYVKGVRFKAKSRYLKHDLTRGDVLQDEDFRKLLSLIGRLAREQLPAQARKELEELASRPAARPALSARWSSFAAFMDPALARNWAIFPLADGRAFSVRRLGFGLAKAGGRLLYEDGGNRVTEAFAKEDVHALAKGPWVETAAAWLGAEAVRASSAYLCPKIIRDRKLEPPIRSLLSAFRAVDSAGQRAYAGFVGAEGGGEERLFALQDTPGALTENRPLKARVLPGAPRPWAVLYSEHPVARALAALHGTDPVLSCFLGLKILQAEGGSAGRIDELELLRACVKTGTGGRSA